MATLPSKLEFSYDGMPVGYFEEEHYPVAPGRYRYEPYRGSGHYEVQTALDAGTQPRCIFQVGGRTTSFAVVGCPEYGVLELAEFDGGNLG